MILADMSNLAITALQEAGSGGNPMIITEQTIRHVVLKKIYDVYKKIGTHHELVLACDGKDYFRKDLFSYYKANRVKNNDCFDWDDFRYHYPIFKAELPYYFPFKLLEIDKVEGDDIINCITDWEIANGNRHIIIASSDTDDLQISERYPNWVEQYSFKKRGYITCADYNYSLKQHIIEGDKGDGIPNIMSDDDTYMNPAKRSKTLTKKRRDQFEIEIPEEFQANYERNKSLVDMSQIPDHYRQAIIEEYLKPMPPKEDSIYKYCIKYKLARLMKFIA